MKWLVTALSVITLSIWGGFVLFFLLDLDQNEYISAEKHPAVIDINAYKSGNFIFRSSPIFSNRRG
ncbi:hypothetical protein [Gracilibacillus boraciitolerans]|uniref:hypothetical protein n=1 Tax=Gracilibacillus boraciitolerans TaxID=307521 RepID=UPI0005540880|nr:hypothetical protein [Gracilibacillus boraciitolerans]